MSKVRTVKITDPETREKALQVVKAVYYEEKKWITSVENEIQLDLATNKKFSWFLATVDDKPAGLLRLLYDPPLELPKEFKVTLKKDIDIKKIAAEGKFVDIGRFMILPEYRKKILVALRLMRIAIKEVVERDYRYFVTDVFENEPHSPYRFHTKILGFEVIGTHLHGELNCSCTRIILTLDILKAYKRLKERKNKVYWTLTEGIQELLEKKLAMRIS